MSLWRSYESTADRPHGISRAQENSRPRRRRDSRDDDGGNSGPDREPAAPEAGQNDDFVLADYFDFVAGTSTGAIIAACISIGMKVADIRTFYIGSGEEMFDKAFLLKRFHHKYEDENLAAEAAGGLRQGHDPGQRQAEDGADDGDAQRHHGFALAGLEQSLRQIQPARTRPDCNLHLPLWQLVRASTAAPVYFPPEVVKLGDHDVRVRGWRHHHLQQPGVSGLFDGDGGAVQDELAGGRRQDAGGVHRHRHQPEGRCRPQPGQDEPALQRRFHSRQR